MKTLYFITGNTGKVMNLQRKLERHGIEVIQKKLDLSEIQADEVAEVSINKAKIAFGIIKQPLVVDDSGFFIEELNGFPGVYTKYILSTIGVEGIMNLMENKENRRCNFKSVVTYIDTTEAPTVFNGEDEKGVIANFIDSMERVDAWSDLWKIFIPYGYKKTLSQLTIEERKERSKKREGMSAFSKFEEWIANS